MTLSRRLHNLIWQDADQSICARAWANRERGAWRAVVAVFGRDHCKRSWWHYHADIPEPVVWFVRDGNLIIHAGGEDRAVIPGGDIPHLMVDLAKFLKGRIRNG